MFHIPWRLRKQIIVLLFATSPLNTWHLLKSFLWDLLKLSKHWACKSFCSGHVFYISGRPLLLWTVAAHLFTELTHSKQNMTLYLVFLVTKEGLLHIFNVITLFVHSYVVAGLFFFLTKNSPCHLLQIHTWLQSCYWQILVFVYRVSWTLWPCTCPCWISTSPFPPQTYYTILPNHSEFKACPPVLMMSLSIMPSENLITVLSFPSSNSLMKAYARSVSRRDLAELHFCILPLWQSTIDNLSDRLSNQLCVQSITVSSSPGCRGSLMRMPHAALLKTLVRG